MLIALAAFSSFILAFVVHALLSRRLALTSAADAIHFALTRDGKRIAVHRYEPKLRRQGELPVILCHGLGANRFNLDLDQRYSFARYLKGRGYDVFVMELRGAGASDDGSPRRHHFDDHVLHDAPAVIELVCEITGAEKVNWVGHSLGGMIAYAALGTDMRDRLHAIAALGSPATFAHQPLLRFVARLFPLLRPVSGYSSRIPARVGAPFFITIVAPFFSFLGNVWNIEAYVVRRVLWNLVSDVSPNVLADFVSWIRRGVGPHVSTQTDPDAHWATVEQPLLLIAGAADWALAPPAAIRHAFYKAKSENKEIIVLSKKNGFSADYGHGDLALGKRAPEEVFPLVERFLWQNRRLGEASAPREVKVA